MILVLISSYPPLVFLFSVFARKHANNAHNEASSADISILLNFASELFFPLFTSQSAARQPQNGTTEQDHGQLLSLPLRRLHETFTVLMCLTINSRIRS